MKGRALSESSAKEFPVDEELQRQSDCFESPVGYREPIWFVVIDGEQDRITEESIEDEHCKVRVARSQSML